MIRKDPSSCAFPSLSNPCNKVSFCNKAGFYFSVHDVKYSDETFLLKYLSQIGHNEPN